MAYSHALPRSRGYRRAVGRCCTGVRQVNGITREDGQVWGETAFVEHGA
ncbi:hypothetical protein J2Z21_004201 [Streptomyces griseochromogenes]|uniref:Uncharacterized protein n=1 Tax=Streptomyces griseochromogenes TaxID=68214 RepID=A0ABS4LUZ1_9ACTN|nr:hypothetical protein [Streptomyces griseochromogenes]